MLRLVKRTGIRGHLAPVLSPSRGIWASQWLVFLLILLNGCSRLSAESHRQEASFVSGENLMKPSEEMDGAASTWTLYSAEKHPHTFNEPVFDIEEEKDDTNERVPLKKQVAGAGAAVRFFLPPAHERF